MRSRGKQEAKMSATPMKRLTLSLPQSLVDTIKAAAAEAGMSYSSFVEDILRSYLQNSTNKSSNGHSKNRGSTQKQSVLFTNYLPQDLVAKVKIAAIGQHRPVSALASDAFAAFTQSGRKAAVAAHP
jgi:hypothetical protein